MDAIGGLAEIYSHKKIINESIHLNSENSVFNRLFILDFIYFCLNKFENKFFAYNFFSVVIIVLNFLCLKIVLNYLKLSKIHQILIILFFLFLPNQYIRILNGHQIHASYFIFFLNYYFLSRCIHKANFKNFSYFIFSNIFFLFFNLQYIVYCAIFNLLFIFYSYFKNKSPKLFILIIYSIFFVLFLTLLDNFLNRNYDLDQVNKYAIKNPLEIFYFFEYPIIFLDYLINFFSNPYIITNFEKHYFKLIKYGFNTQEFTYFINPFYFILFFLFSSIKIIKLNKDNIFYICSILFFISLSLISIFPFSLLSFNLNLFPYIRSVIRIFSLIDFVIILFLIEFLKINNIFFYTKKSKIIFIILLISNMFFLSQFINKFGFVFYEKSQIIDLPIIDENSIIYFYPIYNEIEKNYFNYITASKNNLKTIFINKENYDFYNNKILNLFDDSSNFDYIFIQDNFISYFETLNRFSSKLNYKCYPKIGCLYFR